MEIIEIAARGGGENGGRLTPADRAEVKKITNFAVNT